MAIISSAIAGLSPTRYACRTRSAATANSISTTGMSRKQNRINPGPSEPICMMVDQQAHHAISPAIDCQNKHSKNEAHGNLPNGLGMSDASFRIEMLSAIDPSDYQTIRYFLNSPFTSPRPLIRLGIRPTSPQKHLEPRGECRQRTSGSGDTC